MSTVWKMEDTTPGCLFITHYRETNAYANCTKPRCPLGSALHTVIFMDRLQVSWPSLMHYAEQERESTCLECLPGKSPTNIWIPSPLLNRLERGGLLNRVDSIAALVTVQCILVDDLFTFALWLCLATINHLGKITLWSRQLALVCVKYFPLNGPVKQYAMTVLNKATAIWSVVVLGMWTQQYFDKFFSDNRFVSSEKESSVIQTKWGGYFWFLCSFHRDAMGCE